MSNFEPVPFRVNFTEHQLAGLQARISAAKTPGPFFEARHPAHNAGDKHFSDFGVSSEWILNAKKYWQTKFDWRKQEAKLVNNLPHIQAKFSALRKLIRFLLRLDRMSSLNSKQQSPPTVRLTPLIEFNLPVLINSLDIAATPLNLHFIHEPSPKPDAIPLLLIHGWPGSCLLEFRELIQILKKTEKFHLVAASTPGYLFSEIPIDEPFDQIKVGDYLNELMKNLGYGESYAIQAGDWGSMVLRLMAIRFPQVRLVHQNYIYSDPPPSGTEGLTQEELNDVERINLFKEKGWSYASEHTTKPATIAWTVASSPMSLLAWIGEKFLAWTDKDPSLDEILTEMTLYELTDTFPRSIYAYWQRPEVIKKFSSTRIEVPVGYSLFPYEIAPTPLSWAKQASNVVWFRKHTAGGHFAAMEQPEELAKDLEEYFGEWWPKAKK